LCRGFLLHGRFYDNSSRWEGPYPRWFVDWVDAERRAAVRRWWEPLLVPGLLQTPEYARVLFKAWQTTEDDDEVENLVTARIDRQRIFDQPKPPSFWAVIDEGVLRRRIGGNGGNCIEVGAQAEAGRVLVRDTKDRPGPCSPSVRKPGVISPNG
jgi:hypothetical protein